MTKKKLVRILIGLIIISLIGFTTAYFVIKPEKPWLAFFVACCGGVLIFNFMVSLFLIIKNFKK